MTTALGWGGGWGGKGRAGGYGASGGGRAGQMHTSTVEGDSAGHVWT